jgi:FkbM family methyltransferase
VLADFWRSAGGCCGASMDLHYGDCLFIMIDDTMGRKAASAVSKRVYSESEAGSNSTSKASSQIPENRLPVRSSKPRIPASWLAGQRSHIRSPLSADFFSGLVKRLSGFLEYLSRVPLAEVWTMRSLTRSAAAEMRQRTVAREQGRAPESGAKTQQIQTLYLRALGKRIYLRTHSTDILVADSIFFQEEYRDPLEHLAAEPNYIMDLGANVGYATKYFLQRFPTSRIFFIEPDFRNFSIAILNLSDEILAGKCRGLNAAVWTEDCLVSLEAEGRGEWFFRCRPTRPGEDGIPAYSLASLIAKAGFPRIDLLKIDVEGAETDLFREDPSRWISHVSCLVCELHEGFTHEEFVARFSPHGFTCYQGGNSSIAARRSPVP